MTKVCRGKIPCIVIYMYSYVSDQLDPLEDTMDLCSYPKHLIQKNAVSYHLQTLPEFSLSLLNIIFLSPSSVHQDFTYSVGLSQVPVFFEILFHCLYLLPHQNESLPLLNFLQSFDTLFLIVFDTSIPPYILVKYLNIYFPTIKFNEENNFLH